MVYERAVFFNPELADAHRDLGSAFLQIDALNAAIACFERAIELAPGRPEAHFNLGRALIVQGENLAAIDELEAQNRLEPDLLDLVEFGNALAAHGCADESVETR